MTKTNKDDVRKSYFCSELVAACHKELGIFPQKLAASQYWPSTYALPSSDLNNNWVTKESNAEFDDLQVILY